MRRSRETWVALLQTVACLLIGAVPVWKALIDTQVIADSMAYSWFARAVSFFGYPMLFLCSGYVYQQNKPEKGDYNRAHLAVRKLVGLGIPFVVFSCLAWLVGGRLTGAALAEALLIRPAAPYWYLYILLLMFVVTPAITTKISAVILGCAALGTKIVAVVMKDLGLLALDYTLDYWIWFVIGMILRFTEAPKALRKLKGAREMGVLILVLFFVGTIAVIMRGVSHSLLNFLFTLVGCSGAAVMAMTAKFPESAKATVQRISDYTMPLLMMHRIFITLTGAILTQAGVDSPALIAGCLLIAGFGGPVLVGFVFKKLKWPEFVLYPGKFIKFKWKKEGSSHGKKA